MVNPFQGKTRISFNSVSDLDALVEYSAEILKNDGVILTPTDTVYGLICLPASDAAITKVFQMKGRPVQRHLPIIVANGEQARKDLPIVWSDAAERLSRTYWPGALTLAFGIRQNEIPWLEGRVEVGIRVPDFLYVKKLARKVGPFFMTSANRHGEETPHTLEGAMGSLLFAPDLALDGGLLCGSPSTLVNLNLPEPKVERIGAISEAEIARVIQHG